jgi:DNA repair exonuclease SbcCD ATPase subunit
MNKREAAHAFERSTARTPLNYFNYFTEIEDTFIRRRGKHLLLSPMDWALIESWKEMGVPLHVALRGIERAFDSYESRPRNRSVKSLMYCQEEVEAQFAEWLESQRGASSTPDVADEGRAVGSQSAEGLGGLPFPRAVIAAHLSECRDALSRAREKRSELAGNDALSEALARASSRLEELAADFDSAARPDAEKLESSLTDLEALIGRALRESLPAEAVEEKRAEAEEQLRPYRARMERATYEQTLDNLLAKALRESAGVPRLSLFYL